MGHDTSSKDTIPHQTSTLLCDVKGCIISSFIHTCYPPIYQFNQSTQKQNIEIDLKRRQAGSNASKPVSPPAKKVNTQNTRQPPNAQLFPTPFYLSCSHTSYFFFFVFSLYLASNQPLPSRKKSRLSRASCSDMRRDPRAPTAKIKEQPLQPLRSMTSASTPHAITLHLHSCLHLLTRAVESRHQNSLARHALLPAAQDACLGSLPLFVLLATSISRSCWVKKLRH